MHAGEGTGHSQTQKGADMEGNEHHEGTASERVDSVGDIAADAIMREIERAAATLQRRRTDKEVAERREREDAMGKALACLPTVERILRIDHKLDLLPREKRVSMGVGGVGVGSIGVFRGRTRDVETCGVSLRLSDVSAIVLMPEQDFGSLEHGELIITHLPAGVYRAHWDRYLPIELHPLRKQPAGGCKTHETCEDCGELCTCESAFRNDTRDTLRLAEGIGAFEYEYMSKVSKALAAI